MRRSRRTRTATERCRSTGEGGPGSERGLTPPAVPGSARGWLSLAKSGGLKIRSCRGSRVRIPSPALLRRAIREPQESDQKGSNPESRSPDRERSEPHARTVFRWFESLPPHVAALTHRERCGSAGRDSKQGTGGERGRERSKHLNECSVSDGTRNTTAEAPDGSTRRDSLRARSGHAARFARRSGLRVLASSGQDRPARPFESRPAPLRTSRLPSLAVHALRALTASLARAPPALTGARRHAPTAATFEFDQ